MIKLSTYLPKSILEKIREYGALDAVVNDILKLCERGDVQLFDRPYHTTDEKQLRVTMNIDSEWYEGLLFEYGMTSSRISMKRLLCWFFDIGMPDKLGWEKEADYIDKATSSLLKALITAEGELKRRVYSAPQYAEEVFAICNAIQELREKIQ